MLCHCYCLIFKWIDYPMILPFWSISPINIFPSPTAFLLKQLIVLCFDMMTTKAVCASIDLEIQQF